MECKCYTEELTTTGILIHYCPLHKAAPDLLQACQRALTIIESNLSDTHPAAIEKLRQALAKAEVKDEGKKQDK